jgi:hypothetical protein
VREPSSAGSVLPPPLTALAATPSLPVSVTPLDERASSVFSRNSVVPASPERTASALPPLSRSKSVPYSPRNSAGSAGALISPNLSLPVGGFVFNRPESVVVFEADE